MSTQFSRLIHSAVSAKVNVSQAIADEIAGHILHLITQELGRTGRVNLPGFGAFALKEKPATPARTVRNPKTGEPLAVEAKPAQMVVKFRPAK